MAGEGPADLDGPVQQGGGEGIAIGGFGVDHELHVGAARGTVLECDPGDRRAIRAGGAVVRGGHHHDLATGPGLQSDHARAQSVGISRPVRRMASDACRHERGDGVDVPLQRETRGEPSLEGGRDRGREMIDEEHRFMVPRTGRAGQGKRPGGREGMQDREVRAVAPASRTAAATQNDGSGSGRLPPETVPQGPRCGTRRVPQPDGAGAPGNRRPDGVGIPARLAARRYGHPGETGGMRRPQRLLPPGTEE